jgi:hypothetical protein
MDVMTKMADLFLYCFGFGVFFSSILANPEKTGGSFFKVLSVISLVSLLISLSINLSEIKLNSVSGLYFIVPTLFAFFYWYYNQRDKRNWMSDVAFAILIFVFLLITGHKSQYQLSEFIYILVSTLFIGVVSFTMILGHWYLVTPKLSVSPLLHGLIACWIFLAVKTLISVYATYNAQEFFITNTELGSGYSFNVMMLSCRFLIGYLALMIVSIFAWKLTKMNDTQGATGIFYVMMIFLFIGELFSSYLFFNHGLLI